MSTNARVCRTADEIFVGNRFELIYIITDDDTRKFAEISGDWNPIHFDEDYARETIFKRRIAHGLVSLAKFSGIFGMDLPGLGTLWETQHVRFAGPVFLNEPYKAVALVSAVDRRRVAVETWVEDVSGKRVLEGCASVLPISPAVRARLRAIGVSILPSSQPAPIGELRNEACRKPWEPGPGGALQEGATG